MYIDIDLQTAKHITSIITIVEPTGVPAVIEIRIPVAAPIAEKMQEKTVTFLKLLNRCIAEIAGKIMSAEIKSEPTRFIARTMIVAITVAITIFSMRVGVPQANAKSSSKVIANILL